MNASREIRTRRSWCERGRDYGVDECGFLVDPEGHFRQYVNPGLVRVADLKDRDCLVLLGEPGMGKTTSMEAERRRQQREIGASGGLLIWKDLGVYGDESRLIHDLFEAPEWGR